MSIPLGLYEFLAYVFPGATVIVLVTLVSVPLHSIVTTLTVTQSVSFAIFLGFVIGHLLQSLVAALLECLRTLSFYLESKRERRLLRWLYRWFYQFRNPSSELIKPAAESDQWRKRRSLLRRLHVVPYSDWQVKQIEHCLGEFYGTLEGLPRHEFYSLCYGIVSSRTPGWGVYSALSKFYEGMAGALFIAACIALYGATTGRLVLPGQANAISASSAWVAAAISSAIALTFLDRYRRFQIFTANAVYSSLLGYHADLTLKASLGDQDAR